MFAITSSEIPLSSTYWGSIIAAIGLVACSYAVAGYIGAVTLLHVGGAGVVTASTIALVRTFERGFDRSKMASSSMLSAALGTAVGLVFLLVVAAIGLVDGTVGIHLGFMWTLLAIGLPEYATFVVVNTVVAGVLGGTLSTVSSGLERYTSERHSTHDDDAIERVKASYMNGRISDGEYERRVERILEARRERDQGDDREPVHDLVQDPEEKNSTD